jgi:protocatechuate 3,4-dioxygenase beta subunit
MRGLLPSSVPNAPWTRRGFLRLGALLPALWAQAGTLAPTPACAEPEDLPATAPLTEGPFFSPRSPERTSLLEPGLRGTPIDLGGRVLDTHGRPVAGALLDFWHADDHGEYDTQGYRYRGHQFADAEGRYHLRTIVPAAYGGRTRHYHVKVQAPRASVLTTQLYFPGEESNGSDALFREGLLLRLGGAQGHRRGRFDFVLALA